MSKRILWCSDIHLNFLTDPYPGESDKRMRTLSEPKVRRFCEKITSCNPEAVIITGDISEASYLDIHLAWLSKYLAPLPIYFVLGNHDYYGGSIATVREFAKRFNDVNISENLFWLNVCDVVKLTDKTVLVGHDGWYDGQYANWFAPGVVIMNDYYSIAELRDVYAVSQTSMVEGDPRVKTFAVMQRLANDCAIHIRDVLPKACGMAKNIVFATHVPPFAQNSVYNGKMSDAKWLPNFSSKLAGDALLEIAKSNPNNNFTILCGHSHGKAEYHPLPNMVCHTRFSEYKYPEKSIMTIEVE